MSLGKFPNQVPAIGPPNASPPITKIREIAIVEMPSTATTATDNNTLMIRCCDASSALIINRRRQRVGSNVRLPIRIATALTPMGTSQRQAEATACVSACDTATAAQIATKDRAARTPSSVFVVGLAIRSCPVKITVAVIINDHIERLTSSQPVTSPL